MIRFAIVSRPFLFVLVQFLCSSTDRQQTWEIFRRWGNTSVFVMLYSPPPPPPKDLPQTSCLPCVLMCVLLFDSSSLQLFSVAQEMKQKYILSRTLGRWECWLYSFSGCWMFSLYVASSYLIAVYIGRIWCLISLHFTILFFFFGMFYIFSFKLSGCDFYLPVYSATCTQDSAQFGLLSTESSPLEMSSMNSSVQ